MNTVLKKSIFASVVILASSSFVNCNKKTPEKIQEPATLYVDVVQDHLVEKVVQKREPIVFITGFDTGNDSYYNDARLYFEEKEFEIVEDQYSIEEIINWLNRNRNEYSYGDIHIVNKSNPYKGMTLETIVKGECVTSETLRKNITKGTLPVLHEGVNANSRIIFHANGLGENTELMKTLKDAFCADELPSVIASPYYSIFNGEFSKHYLAKPYYVFYPTSLSPGKVDLSKEIARKYPEEKDVNWYDALNTDTERYIGEAYSKKFNIPIKFELDYHNSDDEVPTFTTQDEVMDFIEQMDSLYNSIEELQIPIEKYRWTWRLRNSKLTIKGMTTGIIVLKPLIKPYGELEHVQPDTNNKRLYAMN